MSTEAEIYEDIHQEIIDDVSIGATSDSKVSEHARITLTITRISSILQGLWDIFKRVLENVAETVPTCNAAWWDREIRKFQFGDSLLLDNITKKYYYATTDESKQIIQRVAISDQSGRGIIKVAKEDNVALTASELSALTSYIKNIQPLGSNIVIISQDADLIKIVGTIYFDPIIPEATIIENVEAAVSAYIAALNFKIGQSGVFYTTKLIDAIQEVEGVVDVNISQVQASQNVATSLATVARKYTPVSGHITIDPNSKLSSTLTYTSEL